jgi:hypothetical protein
LWYHDPTGFSIGVPQGWHISHDGHLVYVRDPCSGRFLIIDQTTHPKPDPLADWRQQEASRRNTYPGYHLIRVKAVHHVPAERAADWEFTYYYGSQLDHVLNRNILASAHHAYALYWSTPASEWQASFPSSALSPRPSGTRAWPRETDNAIKPRPGQRAGNPVRGTSGPQVTWRSRGAPGYTGWCRLQRIPLSADTD